MNTDKILNQIQIHQQTFAWIIKETESIVKEVLDMDNQVFNADRYNDLSKKLLELQLRYQQDRKQYSKSIRDLKKHFKKTYDIDIVGILEDNTDVAK